ncbi:MAG: tRNA (adenosine(37)-N6)-dimethylallyltransferase MiaA [Acidobacteriota bacterium]
MTPSPLIVIAGPTAVGKSALGVDLAEAIGGEIVSADAFAVYRGMDIGTDKPDAVARERVRHHLVDVADPREAYSAGRFIQDAEAAIADIRARGRRPVVVGGTMFYIRALRYGLFPEPPKDAALRARLEAEWDHDPRAVRARLEELDPLAAQRSAPTDRQRTLRALEVCLVAGRPISELWAAGDPGEMRHAAVVLALTRPREELRARIQTRVERMFSTGLVEEVGRLLEGGVPPQSHALKAIGYRQALGVVLGAWSAAEAREATVQATRRLAKRQMTWLRSEPGVTWLEAASPSLLEDALRRLEACGE